MAETLHAPEDAFAEMEFDEEYRKALAALTPDERAVFELRFHDDMSYREIADRLTIKRETVNSRLRNARAEMRKHFSKVYDLA